MVPKAQHASSISFQDLNTPEVVELLIVLKMLASIQLDPQARFVAIKVEDEALLRMLPTEFRPF